MLSALRSTATPTSNCSCSAIRLCSTSPRPAVRYFVHLELRLRSNVVPFWVCVDRADKTLTGARLYELVLQQLRRVTSSNVQGVTAGAAAGSYSPFTLRVGLSQGKQCGLCESKKACRGCAIVNDGAAVNIADEHTVRTGAFFATFLTCLARAPCRSSWIGPTSPR
jgi:hypothetical protein